MINIRFSHNYDKFPIPVDRGAPTFLIGIQYVEHFADLPPTFIDYDSVYRKPYVMEYVPGEPVVEAEEVEFFDFAAYGIRPETPVLVLFLYTQGPGAGQVWTTIRRWIQSKYDYYRDHVNEQVHIEITPEGK